MFATALQNDVVSLRTQTQKNKSKSKDLLLFFWRRHPDLNRRIKALQASALPLGYGAVFCLKKRLKGLLLSVLFSGAGYEARTRYLHLGKVALYQMS